MSTITIIRGDDQSFDVSIKNADATPVDLTGATVFFTVKKRTSDTDDEALISKDITSHTTPASGLTNINLDNEDTEIDPSPIGKPYKWDLQVKGADGSIYSTEAGDFVVLADVTSRKTI